MINCEEPGLCGGVCGAVAGEEDDGGLLIKDGQQPVTSCGLCIWRLALALETRCYLCLNRCF